MMLDSSGIPVTKNEAGYDGGDSLANYCRYSLARYKLNPSTAGLLRLDPFLVAKGIVRRHPGIGLDPEGKEYKNVPDFWTNPLEVSRDNSRALHWLVALRFDMLNNGLYPKALSDLEDINNQYLKRKSLYAQNKDILLPFQFAKKGLSLLLRDIELMFNLSVVCGIIPSNKHDKPFGFGKGKSWFFSWQDEDHVDGDVNMAADLIGCSLLKPTLISNLALKVYKKMRSSKAILHYYRKESGNNPEIGETLCKALGL